MKVARVLVSDAPEGLLLDLVGSYTETKALLLKLPMSRARSLAITALEDSYLRAAMAIANIDCPIEVK